MTNLGSVTMRIHVHTACGYNSAMRLLVVEDDRKIEDFLCQGLGTHGFVVDPARDGLEGLNLATMHRYDVLIVDLMLPKLDGLSLIAAVAAIAGHDTSAHPRAADGDDRVRRLQTGGDDYLTKPFAFAELLARSIRWCAALRRTRVHALCVRAAEPRSGVREVRRDGHVIDLQPREFDLLAYLMRNAGRVVSKTMIMENVWDYNFDPQTNVVEARLSRLRDKIDKNGAAQAHSHHSWSWICPSRKQVSSSAPFRFG